MELRQRKNHCSAYLHQPSLLLLPCFGPKASLDEEGFIV